MLLTVLCLVLRRNIKTLLILLKTERTMKASSEDDDSCDSCSGIIENVGNHKKIVVKFFSLWKVPKCWYTAGGANA